ncbi:hypothetical protein GOV04_02295 [Candidatus Woesearchaeota archaeon]|nr:hypothetical protein [Candidatus Woesearchaeota archaeon]
MTSKILLEYARTGLQKGFSPQKLRSAMLALDHDTKNVDNIIKKAFKEQSIVNKNLIVHHHSSLFDNFLFNNKHIAMVYSTLMILLVVVLFYVF